MKQKCKKPTNSKKSKKKVKKKAGLIFFFTFFEPEKKKEEDLFFLFKPAINIDRGTKNFLRFFQKNLKKKTEIIWFTFFFFF